MATPISQIPFRFKGQITCIFHKGRQLELYCEKCQEPVCLHCISSIHKSHSICELSEISPQKKQDITNFINRVEQNDLEQVRKYIKSTHTLLQDNTNTFEKLSCQLKMRTDKLKQDLDLLAAQTLSIYKKMEEDNNRLIQNYMEELNMYEKHMKQQIEECNIVLNVGSHIQIYDKSCEIHSPTSLPVKPVLDTASFDPNKNSQRLLELALGQVILSGQGQLLTKQDRSGSKSDDKGQFSRQQSGRKEKKAVIRKKLLSETKVVEEWESPCYITSICQTTDGQVWTSDYSGVLTLLDGKGKIIQKVTHKSIIYDISLSPTTHTLWVCDSKNNIMELVSGQLTKKFRTKQKPRCMCVTAGNHIIVGMDKHVSKFTTQGQMVLTTMAIGTGKPLVYSPHRISECAVTNNVAVVDSNTENNVGDGNQRVVVMDTEFQKLFVYRGDIPRTYKQTPPTESEPFDPYGVVYDSVGNLIIGDNNNCRVLLLSGGGEFLRIIYTDANWTSAVGVDRKNVLWAVFGYRDMKLLQYSSV
ncbi:uncharacterized protein LOC132548298 [Ylistrum balloti]|uniref:uncharacterized protein LOC132548298 n=1 Tax=Ylistrum balloti TaxID=509963 RepID=UPI00290581D3|nr:uncharacterized protein LOC132548298 [Ylistrum balloti]